MALKVLIFLFLLPHLAVADHFEALGGALVYHPQQASDTPQTVTPFMAGLRYNFNGETYTAISGFTGQDSYLKAMFGGAYSVGKTLSWAQIGMAVGGFARPSLDYGLPFMGIEFNLFHIKTLLSPQLMVALLGLEI